MQNLGYDPGFPPPYPHLPSPQAIWLREGPTKRERSPHPQATLNRKLSRVEATETQQGDPLTRNRRKDGFAPPWAADCVPLRIQHWVFETAMISTRIEGRSGLSPTPAAAARDRDPNSTRWQPHSIQPKLDNHGSIEGSFPNSGLSTRCRKRSGRTYESEIAISLFKPPSSRVD